MDEYDVLGNFRDLKNIYKNIPAEPVHVAPSELENLGNEFNDSDILADFEACSPKKKKSNKLVAKADKNQTVLETKIEIAPKAEETVNLKLDLTNQEEGVAYRTRRGLRNSNDNSTHINAQYAPVDQLNTSTARGRKSARGCAKKSNADTSLTNPRKTNNNAKNANKSTRGRSRKNNTNNAPTIVTATTAAPSIAVQRGETHDAMRARRNFIAEHAARCRTVDVVDLVSSPMPRVEGFIDLDAESSTDAEKPVSQQQSLDFSFDDDNPEMSIKINWQFKVEIFKLRKYQKFTSIFEELAKRENVEIHQIFLNLNNQIIKPDDTPAAINYKIYQFIDGRAMESFNLSGTGAIPKKKRDPNIIKVKVQSDKFKKPLHIELNKTENFRKLVIKCAEELKIPYKNIVKLCFDGETLEHDQTPLDLELEGGEIIEIHLKD